ILTSRSSFPFERSRNPDASRRRIKYRLVCHDLQLELLSARSRLSPDRDPGYRRAEMNTTLMLIDLAGAVALLIWGVHMVQTGVTRAFGPQLRRALGYAFANRPKAFLAGLGVTAILQSSTATGLMVTSFAAGGLVDLVPALAVMLGANVGTTLIVQVLSFNVSEVSFLLILLGVVMFRRTSVTRPADLGRVGIGLGLMLIALQHLLAITTPYEDAPSLRMLLGAVPT